MKKAKKTAVESERLQILVETTARAVAEVHSRLEGGLKALSRELADSAKGLAVRFDDSCSSLTEAVATVHADVRRWRHDFADIEARLERVEKKLGLVPRGRASR
jgi:ubiquinone biosynthesis protein UbiJ